MFIEVTHRSQAVDALLRGAILWCRETSEGKQLCSPNSFKLLQHYDRSKRCVRRMISRWYADAREETGKDVLHFVYNFQGD